MLTPGDRVTPEYRSKRQSGSSLVRCDLNVTGDYLFYQEVTRDLGSLSVEEKEEVALSLLVSYVQGASEIYKVRLTERLFPPISLHCSKCLSFPLHNLSFPHTPLNKAPY